MQLPQNNLSQEFPSQSYAIKGHKPPPAYAPRRRSNTDHPALQSGLLHKSHGHGASTKVPFSYWLEQQINKYIYIYVCIYLFIDLNLNMSVVTLNINDLNTLGCQSISLFKKCISSLDWCGSVGWVSFANPKVAGSIPNQGTHLGCRPCRWLGHMQEEAINVSLPLFLPPFPSL